MTERQMIQEILNTEDVPYTFEDVDDDNSQYTLLISQEDGDTRPLKEVNDEIKGYFQETNFEYKEDIHPEDVDADIRVIVKRKD
ncbi:hypothetical protein [Levilactobacillus bambusae]|uniref:Uncharacterized protein n=1 Tax=Levilactobacillus bambusae TaxID=2024736 RepID=A0A2V1N0D3_9LACO|nr:hypothetical protein [Levilactobacillus bambusae]PWF99884.1 hypothetical protein DCM90_06960 [Levilactobacillus bambusae]